MPEVSTRALFHKTWGDVSEPLDRRVIAILRSLIDEIQSGKAKPDGMDFGQDGGINKLRINYIEQYAVSENTIIGSDVWAKLPAHLRRRWWGETDYGKNPPTPELLAAIAESSKNV